MYCTYEHVAALQLDVAGAGAGAGAGRLAASIAGATTSMYTFPPMAPTANATLAAGGMGPPYNHKRNHQSIHYTAQIFSKNFKTERILTTVNCRETRDTPDERQEIEFEANRYMLLRAFLTKSNKDGLLVMRSTLFG